MNNPFSSSTPNELYVVGEHREDPNQLLVQGADGTYYAYALPEGDPQPVEVTEEWQVEDPLPDELLT
jgi:hypothetical protein